MALSWNQKSLDYEIETSMLCHCKLLIRLVEIKSLSITRLKRIRRRRLHHVSLAPLKSKVSRLRDWNVIMKWHILLQQVKLKSKVSRLRDWNSDNPSAESVNTTVEIKSLSITRLKPRLPFAMANTSLFVEIKSLSITRLKPSPAKTWARLGISWNQKSLDYEIETNNWSFLYGE